MIIVLNCVDLGNIEGNDGMDLNNMNDKIAVVTGAAGGIGQTVAEKLAENGVMVAALDKDVVALTTVVNRINETGYQATAFPVDISDHVAVDETIARIERDMGSIEILINVAGLLHLDSVESLEKADWDATFAVNATGVFHVSQSVSTRMIPRRKGTIVTVSSNAANMPRMSMAAYAASKAAATMFTKCMGLELAQYNIRCNIVSPGSTETEMLKMLWKDERGERETIEGLSNTYRVGIPLQKIAKPVDIAEAVLFFVSTQATHITMQDVCVDGGATLGV